MKKLNKFEDYLFNQIFEAVANKEVAVILSTRLKDLLNLINHPIADSLYVLNDDRDTYKSNKVTLVDYDDDDISKFTYVIPSKLQDFTEKELNPIYLNYFDDNSSMGAFVFDNPVVWTKYRNSASIGKVINKIFPGKYKPNGVPGEDIESFTNEVKVERKKSEEIFNRFKIVSGKDIIKYYDVSSYYSGAFGGSNLGGSCMRYSYCSNYIEFYAKNPDVKLVIFMSDEEEDKILGRALLWNIEYIDGNKVDRKFMDRIYYIYDTDLHFFKEYAKKNEWLYKRRQNMSSDEDIVDTLDDTSNSRVFRTTTTFKTNSQYPYMDTMKYFHHDDGYLTNDSDEGDGSSYFLESTHGDYDERGGIWVEYYDRYIHEDELIWCEFGDEYRYSDDAVWIERHDLYATTDYVEDHLVYSEFQDEYLDRDDAVWSDYHDTYIDNDDFYDVLRPGAADAESIDEVDDDNTDPRSPDSINDTIVYRVGNQTYYFDKEDKDSFVSVVSLKDERKVYAHKVWDADRIFRHDGKKYLDDAGSEEKDELIGQTRLF